MDTKGDSTINMQDPMVVSTLFKDVIIPIHNNKESARLLREKTNQITEERNPIQECYDGIFPNQKKFANDIADSFTDRRVINVLALAPTQSGKTGSMVGVIYEALNRRDLAVPKENIFVFTGLSSCEWVQQTAHRFPTWMHDRIFHRNKLDLFIHLLKGRKNVLIIVDEAHIAAKPGQSLFKLYHELQVFDMLKLYSRDIKIVQFTATPDHLQESLPKLFGQNAHNIVHMVVPKEYVSAWSLWEQKRVCQAKKLHDEEDPAKALENIREISQVALTGQPAYHIIRTERGNKHNETIRDFRKVFSNDNCVFISEPAVKKNTQQLITERPNKNTFIFIKDKLRCAQTINHKWVRVLYDRLAHKQKKEAIIQGLWGRGTGFHNNKMAVIWTNWEGVQREQGEGGEERNGEERKGEENGI